MLFLNINYILSIFIQEVIFFEGANETFKHGKFAAVCFSRMHLCVKCGLNFVFTGPFEEIITNNISVVTISARSARWKLT